MRLIFLIILLSYGYNLRAQDAQVFVFLNSKPDKEQLSEKATSELMEQHLANIEQMARDGKLLVAGPFDGGGGIFIFNTSEVAQTQEWLQSDPAIRANRWDLEIFKVSFDKGAACLVGEPYEMVTYNFLRVNFINDIANYKMNNTAVAGWAEAAQEDSVFAIGRFPQYDGGFILYKGNSHAWQDSFSQDQVVFERKKLWVARGAFCE